MGQGRVTGEAKLSLAKKKGGISRIGEGGDPPLKNRGFQSWWKGAKEKSR